MKISTLLFAVIIAASMTSCNEVPEDVISRTEEQHARESAAAEDSKAYAESDFDPYAKVSLAEVKAELNGYKFKAHDNLNFVCEPAPIEAENVYELQVTVGKTSGETADDTDKERLKKAVKAIFDIDITDEWMYSKWPDKTDMTAEHDGIFYGDVYHKSSAFRLRNETPAEVFDLQDNMNNHSIDECMDEKLKMFDGSELTVRDAVTQCDGYINKLRDAGIIDEGESFKATRAAYSNSGGGEILCIHYQQIRHGLPIDDSGKQGAWKIRSGFFEVWMLGNGKPYNLTNMYPATEMGKTAIDKIIPLSSAEFLASDGLAPKMTFDVSEVELRYICQWDAFEFTEPLIYKPMWCFTVKNYPTSKAGMSFERVMIYIDAVTGDFYYSDPAVSQFFTSIELKISKF